MSARQLLTAIDKMPYAERVAYVATEARRWRGTDRLRTTLAELSAGETFDRRLGLFMADVAHEPAYVADALTDPEPAVQGMAVSVAARMPEIGDDQLAELYDDASAWLRRVLVRGLRAGRRHQLAARLVEVAQRRWGDRDALRLLTLCRGEQLAEHLDAFAHLMGPGDWTRLGTLHPAAMLDHADRVLPSLADGQERTDWWQRAGWGVHAATGSDPARVLATVERWLPADELPPPVVAGLGRLVDADATAVSRLLLAPGRQASLAARGLPARALRRAHRFTDEQLGAIGSRLWSSPARFGELLDALPPARRAAVFELATAQLELAAAVLPDTVLEVLPHRVRHEHARRMLQLRGVRDVAEQRWRVAAHLPFDEAFELLGGEAARPEADERGAVYRAVAASAGRSRDPEAVRRALEWLARTRNEQDPVRCAVLQAVAGLPAGVLDARHTAGLDGLVGPALTARDRSWLTEQAIGDIAQKLLVQGAQRAVEPGRTGGERQLVEWGLACHDRLARISGSYWFAPFVDGLPRGLEHRLYDVFRSHIDAAARRGVYDLAFGLARALGNRGWGIEHLQRTLEQALRSTEQHVVSQAVELWLDDPRHRDERVGTLFGRDGRLTRRMHALLGGGVTFARAPAVWQAISERRTDLLDQLFRDPTPSLRFRDLRAWEVRPHAYHRWLPRQCRRYTELLAEVANDGDQPESTRAAAVGALGAVPGCGRGALQPFLTSSDALLRQAALAALARTDRPDIALPQLLALADGEDAHGAVLAAGRAATNVAPSRLAEMLEPVLLGPDRKVTARKEAVRLLGELRATNAAQTFAAAWPAAHRDVKAAMVGALTRQLLDDEGTWPLLAEATRGDVAVARVVADTSPTVVAVPHRPRYGQLIVDLCDHADVDVQQRALRALAPWAPWAAGGVPVCVRALLDLDGPSQHWRAAAAALARFAGLGVGVDELVDAVRTLVAADADGAATDAAADRDRPARRRVAELVHRLTSAVRDPGGQAVRGPALALAAALEPHDSFLRQWTTLRVSTVDWAAAWPDLDALASGLRDRPVEAAHAVGQLSVVLDRDRAYWDGEDLEPLVERLSARGLAGGLCAVTLTRQCGGRLSWPARWRALLRGLRAHEHPDVRAAALTVATATE